MRNILPGRPQSSRQALSTVNWDGLRVVAYISGNTVIVFNGRREILQSIVVDDADNLSALTIEEETGQIAISDKSAVYIYQPLGRDYGDLRWTRAHTLTSEDKSAVLYISWGSSNELLVAGQRLTLWNLAGDDVPQAIWSSDLSTPVSIACLSPDAGLIASCGQHDRTVKIWRRLSYEQDSTRFDVSYLPHPSTVVDLSWRMSWHHEQNLENLLYTFCADGQIRAWAHSEHHAYTALRKVAGIDANMSIQPRRLSMGSISKSRTSFIIASRDLARAAERALQTYRQTTDHALEHLIEIANRSPEVCVILDGKGHMSSWGIENAGLKNKLPADKFNLTLVDGVNFVLPARTAIDDFAQIHAFANNDISASLCILVHSYSGQIDWYQGSFVEFFDTAARTRRVYHVACWSGHASTIDRMVSTTHGSKFVSLTGNGEVILWSETESGTLVRSSEAQSKPAILDAVLLDETGFAVFLHQDAISLWDMRGMKAKMINEGKLERNKPKSVEHLVRASHSQQLKLLLVLHEDGYMEQYSVCLPDIYPEKRAANGDHKPLSRTVSSGLTALEKGDTVELCVGPGPFHSRFPGTTVSWSETGVIQIFEVYTGLVVEKAHLVSRLATQLRSSNIASCLSGRFLALAHANYRTFSIWNLDQGCCEFIETFDKLDSIEELHWHTTGHDKTMLAVQFAYSVAIVSQQRYSMDGNAFAWTILQTIPTRWHSNHVIGSLCWLAAWEIAVGLGNQILTFKVEGSYGNMTELESGKKTRQDLDAEQQLELASSSLPLFNPYVLGDLLQIGKYSAVRAIFGSLHNELRFHSHGDAIILDSGSSLQDLVKQPQLTVLNDGDQRNSEANFDLEGAEPQINEKIPQIAAWQLSVPQQEDLRELLNVSIELMHEQNSLDGSAQTYAYHFLRALGMNDQTKPTKPTIEPLPYSAIVHASLSITQEALLHFVDGHLERRNIKFTWSTARILGLFLWVSDPETLKTYFESVARAEYNRNSEDRNPVNCSLYYLALDKKAILQSLWRRTVGVRERENTLKLLAHDFKDQRWKSTALKNAYALLSKRRFEYAAAFFLLGGSLSDAVNVCINQLHDVQLAIAIVRVGSGDATSQQQTMNNLFDKTMLDLAVNSHEARWMAIWTRTQRRDWTAAISFIIKPIDVLFEAQFSTHRASESDEQKVCNMPFAAMSYQANEPTPLINMYKQLRANLVAAGQWTENVVTRKQEWEFVMRCVHWYVRAGMDWLALQLVAMWEFVEWQEVHREEPVAEESIVVTVNAGSSERQKNALDGWLEPGDATQKLVTAMDAKTQQDEEKAKRKAKPKPPPTQFMEPSADSLLDSFGF